MRLSQRKITERPSVGLGVVQTNKKSMMNMDDTVHICDTCKRQFPTLKSLHGHQRVHTQEKQLERQLKKTKTSYSPGQGTSNSVHFGGCSQNDKYLCFSRDPIESIPVKSTTTFPSRNGGTSYGFSSGTPLVTHNHNHPTSSSNFNRLGGVSFGPFKSGGGGSSRRDYSYSFLNGGISMAPHRSFTQNTRYGSSSRGRLPRYSHSYALPLGISISSLNSVGRFRNNNNSSSQVASSLELSLGPSNSMGGSNNIGSSQGSLSLDLTLGPSKSMGGSNNNSSAYPSLITGGETRNMNMPVRPRVPGRHFYRNNPIDIITRNVPLSHPPPTTSMSRLVRPRASRFHFHGHNPLDSIISNVPLSHPPPTTNLPDDKNVSGSSLIAKEKDKTVVLDDDEKDDVVTGDHGEVDQQEEVEAKSCGRD